MPSPVLYPQQEDYKPLPLGPQSQLFGGAALDELSRTDLSDKHQTPGGLKPPEMMYHPAMAATPHTPPSRPTQVRNVVHLNISLASL